MDTGTNHTCRTCANCYNYDEDERECNEMGCQVNPGDRCDRHLTEDEEIGQFRVTPAAIAAGYMVEGENGEPLLTPKGIAVLKAEMQGDGIIPRDQ